MPLSTSDLSLYKPGDIILFSGNSRISYFIKWVTKSRWSHIGMVVEEDGVLKCFESTLEDTDHDHITGVQLSPLAERLNRYDGAISVRQLKVPLTTSQKNKLQEFIIAHRNKPYERNKWELLMAVYDGMGGANIENLVSLFCSELVAAAYKHMGLLDSHIPSNEYVPDDFSMASKYKSFRFIHQNCLLNQTIEISRQQKKAGIDVYGDAFDEDDVQDIYKNEQAEEKTLSVNNVRFRNFNQAEQTKFNGAIQCLIRVLNSDEFRQNIATLKFTETNQMTNDMIYDQIMSGRDKFDHQYDGNIDIDVTLYTSRNPYSKVIGYTYPGTRRTWLNRRHFARFDIEKLAGHIMHEYCHNLGFEHRGKKSTSVPYQVGALVKKLAYELSPHHAITSSNNHGFFATTATKDRANDVVAEVAEPSLIRSRL